MSGTVKQGSRTAKRLNGLSLCGMNSCFVDVSEQLAYYLRATVSPIFLVSLICVEVFQCPIVPAILQTIYIDLRGGEHILA